MATPTVARARRRLLVLGMGMTPLVAVLAILTAVMLGRSGHAANGDGCDAVLGPPSPHPTAACNAWRHQQVLHFVWPAGILAIGIVVMAAFQVGAIRSLHQALRSASGDTTTDSPGSSSGQTVGPGPPRLTSSSPGFAGPLELFAIVGVHLAFGLLALKLATTFVQISDAPRRLFLASGLSGTAWVIQRQTWRETVFVAVLLAGMVVTLIGAIVLVAARRTRQNADRCGQPPAPTRASRVVRIVTQMSVLACLAISPWLAHSIVFSLGRPLGTTSQHMTTADWTRLLASLALLAVAVSSAAILITRRPLRPTPNETAVLLVAFASLTGAAAYADFAGPHPQLSAANRTATRSFDWASAGFSTLVPAHTDPPVSATSVTCGSPSSCAILAWNRGADDTVEFTTNGITWRSRSLPHPAGIDANTSYLGWIGCFSATACITSHLEATALLETFDQGATWTAVKLPTPPAAQTTVKSPPVCTPGLCVLPLAESYLPSRPGPTNGPSAQPALIVDQRGITMTTLPEGLNINGDRSKPGSCFQPSTCVLFGTTPISTSTPTTKQTAVVAVSTDGGLTWRKHPAPNNLVSLACHAPGTCLALSEGLGEQLLTSISLDDGVHWSSGPTLHNALGSTPACLSAANCLIIDTVQAPAANPDDIAGQLGNLSVEHTTDFGRHWTTTDLHLHHFFLNDSLECPTSSLCMLPITPPAPTSTYTYPALRLLLTANAGQRWTATTALSPLIPATPGRPNT